MKNNILLIDFFKKNVSFVISWSLYYLGHFISKIMGVNYTSWTYALYNWSMVASVDVSDWGNLSNGPWNSKHE